MWQSKRLPRVVKSTITSETLAQLEAVDTAFWVSKLNTEVTGNYIDRNANNVKPIECFIDSRQLVEAVYSIRPNVDRL